MACTPFHWAMQASIFAFLRHEQEYVGAEERWVCVLACAPQHVAAEFVAAVRDQLPCCHLVYVQRNTTPSQSATRHQLRAQCTPSSKLAPGTLLATS